jgi:hypothetical protein
VPAPKTTNLGRKKRKRRQRCKERYAKAREDAQLSGIIPTVPEGAVRNEVAPVAPAPPLPHLVRAAIKNDWPTLDCAKPGIVDSLCAPFYDSEADSALLVKCARVLLLLDRLEEAGKAKGGGAVAVSVQANVEAAAFLNEMIERGDATGRDPGGQPSHDRHVAW